MRCVRPIASLLLAGILLSGWGFPTARALPHRAFSVSLRASGWFAMRTEPERSLVSALVGPGVTLRVRLLRWLGLEATVDYLTGQDHDVRRHSVPMSLVVVGRLVPRGAACPYLVAGFGGMWSTHYRDGNRVGTDHQETGVFGAGLEGRPTSHLVMRADVRAILAARKDHACLGGCTGLVPQTSKGWQVGLSVGWEF